MHVFRIFSTRFLGVFIALLLFQATSPVQKAYAQYAGNLLQNPSFDTTSPNWPSPWYMSVYPDAAATVTQDMSTYVDGNSSARVDINTASPTFWHIQLLQTDVPISQGVSYTITFWAKATTARTINVVDQMGLYPYNSYFSQDIDITTSWQQYTITFTAPVNDSRSLFTFNIGLQTGSVWFDATSFHFTLPDDYCYGQGVYLYTNINWTGACARFTADTPDLTSSIGNGTAQSVRLVGDYAATLYSGTNYTGSSSAVTSDVADLSTTDVGQKAVSSLQIAVPTPTPTILLAPTATPSGTTYSITGNVYNDLNKNGAKDLSPTWQQLTSTVTVDYNDRTSLGISVIMEGASGTDSFQVDDISLQLDSGPNLITNPGCEADTSDWAGTQATLSQDTTDFHSGSASCNVQQTTGDQFSISDQPATVSNPPMGQQYTATVWVRTDSLNKPVWLSITMSGGANPDVTTYSPAFAMNSSEPNYSGGAVIQLSDGEQTVTDANGNYAFNNEPSGTYTVSLASTSIYTPTTSSSQTIDLTSGDQTVNFGLYYTSYTLAGNVFVDTNDDGVQDGSETGFPAGTVTIAGPVSKQVTTDSAGNYSIPNLPTGIYIVQYALPFGYTTSTTNPVTISLVANTIVNFGLSPYTPAVLTNSCGAAAPEADIMLVLDSSGSMGEGSKIHDAIAAAQSFVDTVASQHPASQVGLVTYSTTVHIVDPLMQDHGANQTKLDHDLGTAVADGTTCGLCAMQEAVNQLESGHHGNDTRVIVFLTDGIENYLPGGHDQVPPQTAQDPILALADQEHNDHGTSFFTIGLGTDVDANFLQKLADDTEAKYYFTPTSDQLNSIYASIYYEITQGVGQVKGTVYKDVNFNRRLDAADLGLPSWIATLSNGTTTYTQVTDVSGNYTFTGICTGAYTLQEQAQPGWFQDSPRHPSNYAINVLNSSAITKKNFGNTQGYTVAGFVFDDRNKNQTFDSDETAFTSGLDITFTPTNGTTSTAGSVVYDTTSGQYTVQGLLPGSYIISYLGPLPVHYFPVYPVGAPFPSYVVTVGPGCSVDGTTGGSCDPAGSISDLDFAISDSTPWIQIRGLDGRFDNGYEDKIPPGITAACGPYEAVPQSSIPPATPGIIFSGDQTSLFDSGSSSTTGWVVGGPTYPEVFTPKTAGVMKTSYNYLLSLAQQSNVPITDLSTICNLSNCTLPNGLSHGVYQSNGDLTLNSFIFQGNSNYVILVAGNLHVMGNIQVTSGSTAIFSVGKDIIFDKTIGDLNPICPPTSSHIEGLYSSDQNIIIDGNDNCVVGPDNMLNVQGALVANAGSTGGSLLLHRDLCGNNFIGPALTVTQRPDFILNAPDFIKQQNYFFQEVAP